MTRPGTEVDEATRLWLTSVLREAERQIEDENFAAAVAAEKRRLQAHKSLWQQLLDKLPYTITIQRRTHG